MNAPTSSFFRLSTDQFAERDRIEATREVFGRAIMNVDFEPVPGVPFNMDMVLRALPDFGIAAGTRSAMACVRSQRLIDSDDILVAFVRSGSGVFQFHGREAHIKAGGATVLRTAGNGRLCLPSTADMVTYRLPFNKVAPLVADLDDVLVRPIPATSEALRLLVNYATVLQDEDMLAMPEIRSMVATHLHDLAALAIGATRDAAAAATGRGVRAARLRAIRKDILENLNHGNMSMDTMAARHGISPRYLRKLFEERGTSFTSFVLTQRLGQAQRMLTDRRYAHLNIAQIAHENGFGDVSYFNRVFRRHFGATPTDVRGK